MERQILGERQVTSIADGVVYVERHDLAPLEHEQKYRRRSIRRTQFDSNQQTSDTYGLPVERIECVCVLCVVASFNHNTRSHPVDWLINSILGEERRERERERLLCLWRNCVYFMNRNAKNVPVASAAVTWTWERPAMRWEEIFVLIIFVIITLLSIRLAQILPSSVGVTSISWSRRPRQTNNNANVDCVYEKLRFVDIFVSIYPDDTLDGVSPATKNFIKFSSAFAWTLQFSFLFNGLLFDIFEFVNSPSQSPTNSEFEWSKCNARH